MHSRDATCDERLASAHKRGLAADFNHEVTATRLRNMHENDVTRNRRWSLASQPKHAVPAGSIEHEVDIANTRANRCADDRLFAFESQTKANYL